MRLSTSMALPALILPMQLDLADRAPSPRAQRALEVIAALTAPRVEPAPKAAAVR